MSNALRENKKILIGFNNLMIHLKRNFCSVFKQWTVKNARKTTPRGHLQFNQFKLHEIFFHPPQLIYSHKTQIAKHATNL